MSLKNILSDSLKIAMKARNMERVKVLRNLQAVIKQIEIDQQITLDDNGILQALQKQIKQRQESYGVFMSNGRTDLADKEKFEMNVLGEFMPTPLSDNEIIVIVKQTIGKLNASGMADMGKVMTAVKEATVGRADPSLISKLVKAELHSTNHKITTHAHIPKQLV